MSIFRTIHHNYLICAMNTCIPNCLIHIISNYYRNQASALFICHFPAGSQQFNPYIFGTSILICFYKYPKILCFGFHVFLPSLT